MFQKTGSNYGVNEVLLASVLGSVVFSIFAAQPLVIVGVTGTLYHYHQFSYVQHDTIFFSLAVRSHNCLQLVCNTLLCYIPRSQRSLD